MTTLLTRGPSRLAITQSRRRSTSIFLSYHHSCSSLMCCSRSILCILRRLYVLIGYFRTRINKLWDWTPKPKYSYPGCTTLSSCRFRASQRISPFSIKTYFILMPFELRQELIAGLVEDIYRNKGVEWTHCNLVALIGKLHTSYCLQVLCNYRLLIIT